MNKPANVSYAVRLPTEWEPRFEALLARMQADPPPDVLRLSVSAVVRHAYKVGMTQLTSETGGHNG